MKELALTPKQASIVCAAIGFGAKIEMLYSLLARDPKNDDGIALLKETHKLASRNTFVHGFFDYDPKTRKTKLITRTVKSKYTVRSRTLDVQSFGGRVGKFALKLDEIVEHFGITQNDVRDYERSIVDDAQEYEDRA